MMEQQQWDISTFYSRAWGVIKKHKMLWIFGIAAAAGGGGSSFQSSQNLDANSLKGLEQFFSQPNAEKTVLGASDTVNTTPTIFSIFFEIPKIIYVLLGIEIIFLIIFSIIIGIIYKAWANASLLHAVEDSLNDKQIQIHEVSTKGFRHLRPFVWLSIIPPLVITLGLLACIILVALPVILSKQLFWISLIGILIMLFAIPYVIIEYVLSNIWAPRNVVYHNLSGKNALVTGYGQTKGRFWQMILLGIVNLIASALVIGVPVALVVGVAVGIGVTTFKANPNSLILMLPLGLVVGIAVIFGISLLTGIVTSFKAVVWSLAYKTIKQ